MQPPNSAAVAGREQREGGGSSHYGRARGDLRVRPAMTAAVASVKSTPVAAPSILCDPPGNQERRHPEEDAPYTKQAHQKLDAGLASGPICSNRAVNRGRNKLAAPSPGNS